jgi:hypothetical protein
VQEEGRIVWTAFKKPSPSHRPKFEPWYNNSSQQPECSSQQHHSGLTNEDCSDERSNNDNGQTMIGKACLKTCHVILLFM